MQVASCTAGTVISSSKQSSALRVISEAMVVLLADNMGGTHKNPLMNRFSTLELVLRNFSMIKLLRNHFYIVINRKLVKQMPALYYIRTCNSNHHSIIYNLTISYFVTHQTLQIYKCAAM